MRNNDKIFETVGKIIELKKDLNSITELKNEAFKVFDYESIQTPSIEEMLKIRDKTWKKLVRWDNSKHNGYLSLQSWETIYLAFQKVSGAFINRREFVEMITESREEVEKYIDELNKMLLKEQTYLSERYDKFVKEKNDDDFNYMAIKLKDAFLNEFLQS